MEHSKDIWLIDDDETFRFVVKELLNGSEFADNVAYFDDGDRAILRLVDMAKTGHHGPQVILLDLSMKYLEGWQLMDMLNEFRNRSKVVIVTSSISDRDKARAEREPKVMAYLTKPLSREVLLGTLRGLME